MSEDLPARIEAYLFAAIGWVKGEDMAAHFQVNERAFRSTGRRPGLCTEFAISGDRGFRHVAHATDSEFARAISRMRKHGLGELVHARRLRCKRHAVLASRATPPSYVFERATGQGVLLIS